MITTIIPLILFLTSYPPPVNLLRCYHCSNPSRQIAQSLWIHKTQTCTRRKPMLCPPESVACVIVRVSHPLLSFTASGCSEDKFVGCDLHNLKHINTTMKRCQCSKSFCNKDLHMKGFNLNYGNNNITNTNNNDNPSWANATLFTSSSTNKSHYHIKLLDQLTGENDHESNKQEMRLKMLEKQKEQKRIKEKKLLLLQQQKQKNNNAGKNYFNFISMFSTFILIFIFTLL